MEKALRDAGANHAGDLARLNERLLARADREGLVDVAYATMDSPYGELLVAATERGVVKLSLPNYTAEYALEQIAAGVSPRVLESPKRLDPVRRELDSYFEGRLRAASPRRWTGRLAHGFTDKVLHAVARIPYGKTLSYGEVAEKAGNPRAFRAAGHRLRRQPGAADRPLPPRGAGRRQAGQLRRRAGDEAGAAGDGGRAPGAPGLGLRRPGRPPSSP